MGKGPNSVGLSRKHIIASCDASLKRLDTTYIDLFIVHVWDHVTPIEEVMGALNDLVRAGKVLYLGASNTSAWELLKANHIAERNGWAKFVSLQNNYNAIYREDEREAIPACIDQGIGYTPWAPLGGGFLTGSRKKGEKTDTLRGQILDDMFPHLQPIDADWSIIGRIVELAQKKGVTPAQVALAWVLSKPGVTSPIIGISKMQHLEDAIGALKLQLSADDINYVEEHYVPHSPPQKALKAAMALVKPKS